MDSYALLFAATLNAGTVLAIAALGLLINEKAGIVNLGAAGMMLCAAIAGFATVVHTGNDWLGFAAGMGAGAATGGLIGALVGMGIPEYEAKRYEGRVKDGGILVSAHCDDSDWVSKAKDVLKTSGAEDISSAGEKAASSHGVDSSRVRT